MSVDGRLRNDLARDASGDEVDLDRVLGDVVTKGRRRRTRRRVAGALAIVACIVVIAAFGPSVLNSIRGLRGVPGDHRSTVPGPIVDRLAGSWQATMTRAQLQAVANARFPLAQTKPWDHFLQRLYQHNGHVTTTTITFQDGQLSIDASRDGRPSRSKWTGAYEVVSDDSFVAGDTGTFYITYHYTIDGNRLIVQVVDDRFPDDVGPSPPVIPDLLPQVLIWETALFHQGWLTRSAAC